MAARHVAEADRRRVGLELDREAFDGALRRILVGRGVFHKFIEVEFERVMHIVFAVEREPWRDA